MNLHDIKPSVQIPEAAAYVIFKIRDMGYRVGWRERTKDVVYKETERDGWLPVEYKRDGYWPDRGRVLWLERGFAGSILSYPNAWPHELVP